MVFLLLPVLSVVHWVYVFGCLGLGGGQGGGGDSRDNSWQFIQTSHFSVFVSVCTCVAVHQALC